MDKETTMALTTAEEAAIHIARAARLLKREGGHEGSAKMLRDCFTLMLEELTDQAGSLSCGEGNDDRNRQKSQSCNQEIHSTMPAGEHSEHKEASSIIRDSIQRTEAGQTQPQDSCHTPAEKTFRVGVLPQFLVEAQSEFEAELPHAKIVGNLASRGQAIRRTLDGSIL